jgi:hypothetical protein
MVLDTIVLDILFHLLNRFSFYHQPKGNLNNMELQTTQEIKMSISLLKYIITFPLETPKAYKNKIVKISINPDKPVPDPNVIIKSDGRAFK